MVCAKRTSSSDSRPASFSASSRESTSSELSGVRSSCDMLARNCVLYWEEAANSAAFSESSVFALMVCSATPIVCTNWSKKARWMSLNALNEASSSTPSSVSSYSTGRITTHAGCAWPSPEPMGR
jgi:hypothetical protein